MRRKWLTLMMAIMVLLLSVVSLTACDWQSGGGGSSDGSSNGDDEETVKVTNPVEWFEDFDFSNYMVISSITQEEEMDELHIDVDGNKLRYCTKFPHSVDPFMEYEETIIEMLEYGVFIWGRTNICSEYYCSYGEWYNEFVSVNDDYYEDYTIYTIYMNKKALLDDLYLSDIETMNKYYTKKEDGSWVLKHGFGDTVEITLSYNDDELTFSVLKESGFEDGVEYVGLSGTFTFRKGNGNVSVILPDKEDIVE